MSPDISYKAQQASFITRTRVFEELVVGGNSLPPSIRRPVGAPPDYLPQNPSKVPEAEPSALKVCIVGAGVAGLYTARILDCLGFKYDLYEASDRAGGRVLTHHFSSKPHDYYDIGITTTGLAKVNTDLFQVLCGFQRLQSWHGRVSYVT